MSVEEVLKKEVLRMEDVKVIFGCCKDKAYQFMREIKAVSDITGTRGFIHRKDYEAYINRFNNEKSHQAESVLNG